jgi:hypothetical protein
MAPSSTAGASAPEIIDLVNDDDDDRKIPAVSSPPNCRRRGNNSTAIAVHSRRGIFRMIEQKRLLNEPIELLSSDDDEDDELMVVSPPYPSVAAMPAAGRKRGRSDNGSNRRRYASSGKSNDTSGDFDLAMKLQQEEEDLLGQVGITALQTSLEVDQKLAISLQQAEDLSGKADATITQSSLEEDQKLAMSLQKQEQDDKEARNKAEQEQMLKTAAGKAYAFVERILKCVDGTTSRPTSDSFPAAAAASSVPRSHSRVDIEAVAKDDMVFMAEKFFVLQESFKDADIDTSVDLGFHYTQDAHYKKIRENGLLTISERRENNLGHHSGGQVFGEGIYTANNCFSFSHFGPVGLLVARLKGNCTPRVPSGHSVRVDGLFQTVIGNKQATIDSDGLFDEIVLQKSAQVIPLVRFPQSVSMGTNDDTLNRLYDIMEAVQVVVDEFCNDGLRVSAARLSRHEYQNKQLAATRISRKQYNMKVTKQRQVPTPAAAIVPPAPAFNPLPPSLNFAVVPPVPTGMPTGFTGQWSPTQRQRQRIVAALMKQSPTATPAVASTAQKSVSAATVQLPTTVRAFSSPHAKKPAARLSSSRRSIPGAKTVPATAWTHKVIEYKAPSSLQKASLGNLEKVSAEEMVRLGIAQNECAICLCSFVEQTSHGQTQKQSREQTLLRLPCGHIFHRGCISSSISNLGNRCPFKCNQLAGKPQGKSPSGTMTTTKNSKMHCSGYENDPSSKGIIIIQYHIPKTSPQVRDKSTRKSSGFFSFDSFPYAFLSVVSFVEVLSSESGTKTFRRPPYVLPSRYQRRQRSLATSPVCIPSRIDIYHWHILDHGR